MRERREKLVLDSIRRFRFRTRALSTQQQLSARFFRTLQLADVARQLFHVQSCRLSLFQRRLDILQISLVRETDDKNDRRRRNHCVETVSIDQNRDDPSPVSYTHLRAHETPEHLVCRL